jgi:hypothetical protein
MAPCTPDRFQADAWVDGSALGGLDVSVHRRVRRRARARLSAAAPNVPPVRARRGVGLASIGRVVDRIARRLGVVRASPPAGSGLGPGSLPGSANDDADRVRGVAVVAAVIVALFSLPVGCAIGVAGWNLPRWLDARDSRRGRRVLDEVVVLAVELLAVSAYTGATVPQAVTAVGAQLPEPLGRALRAVGAASAAGVRLDEALGRLVEQFGEPLVPLVVILRAAHLDGDPLEPALARLADRLHAEQRSRDEADARRMSVRLVLPLVCCTLPGFVLIGIAPVVVDALRRSTP